MLSSLQKNIMVSKFIRAFTAILILTTDKEKCVKKDVGWQFVRHYYEEIGFELIGRAQSLSPPSG
jgi:hypothetical protein